MSDEIHIALVRHTNKEANMTTNILKKITVGVLTIITAVCLILGLSVVPDRAFADGEYTSMTVTDVSGGNWEDTKGLVARYEEKFRSKGLIK